LTRIAICTPDLESGDAVSNDAVGMYQALTEGGFEARLFAVNTRITWPKVYKPESIKDFIKNTHDLLLYHHSVGWDIGIHLLQTLQCRKVIKYHNVTPPKYFAGIAENYFIACQSGRAQLKDLLTIKGDLYLADSPYSLRELLGDGKKGLRGAVVPPFHHIDRLKGIEADDKILHRFDDGKTNLLMVGRVVPNKGHFALVDVFQTYQCKYNLNSRLFVVGKEDPGLISYTRSLRSKVREFHLENTVLFTGETSDRALKAYYSIADVFVITSFHEGFCVPLVEAMSMKIPIVAYGSTAVPDTVGKAGFVWEECDPELMAASIDRIVRHKPLRSSLGEMGFRRYQKEFSNDRIKDCLFESLRKTNLIE